MEQSELQHWWHQIAFGKEKEEGLGRFRQDFIDAPSPYHTARLGTAYLFVEQYSLAYDHFTAALASSPATSAGQYGRAGVAQWCLNNPSKAVQLWIEGLDAKYADAAGGVEIPLLLYCASMIDPSLYGREEATNLLRQRSSARRADYWPGPLGRYVLGLIDLPSVRQQCRQAHRGEDRFCDSPLQFYDAIGNRSMIERSAYLERMRQIVERPLTEPFDLTLFINGISREEYYLARWELGAEKGTGTFSAKF